MKSAYIHIPFCHSICSYCDFCKLYDNKVWIKKYLASLELEIKEKYHNEALDTIYIGGGTPSCLSIESLKQLFLSLNILKKSPQIEFTFECNIEDINLEKIKILKNNGVNRISIGVQSFIPKNIKLLNRHHTKEEVFEKIKLLKENGFENINIDLIYAIPGETIEDLEYDLNCFLELDIAHISTYSLIIEENTKLFIDGYTEVDEELDLEMYKLINQKLSNYHHYEISNFAKPKYESKHNLTYWNNDSYYGFGLSAVGYDGMYRYSNTRNLNKYLAGNWLQEKRVVDETEKIENEFILGFRKIDGINIEKFNQKYNIDLDTLKMVSKLINEGKLIKNGNYIKISDDYIYTSNDILVEFIGGNYE
ncbi:MAG: radical SAM family heme chaperone HemW [Firmicutes bacterium]|nr:radical SAM family heme chaperone HemW [Bacillota bacterium]